MKIDFNEMQYDEIISYECSSLDEARRLIEKFGEDPDAVLAVEVEETPIKSCIGLYCNDPDDPDELPEGLDSEKITPAEEAEKVQFIGQNKLYTVILEKAEIISVSDNDVPDDYKIWRRDIWHGKRHYGSVLVIDADADGDGFDESSYPKEWKTMDTELSYYIYTKDGNLVEAEDIRAFGDYDECEDDEDFEDDEDCEDDEE